MVTSSIGVNLTADHGLLRRADSYWRALLKMRAAQTAEALRQLRQVVAR